MKKKNYTRRVGDRPDPKQQPKMHLCVFKYNIYSTVQKESDLDANNNNNNNNMKRKKK